MKAIKFSDYISNNGAIPASIQNEKISVGYDLVGFDEVLESVYGQAYIYLRDADDITSEQNSFAVRMLNCFTQFTAASYRIHQLTRVQQAVLNNNAIHEEVQQKRPPVGGTDFATAYTDGGTVRDLSGGSFPASLYNDVQDWKALYQPVLDLFRPLFHFAAPMACECAEVWE